MKSLSKKKTPEGQEGQDPLELTDLEKKTLRVALDVMGMGELSQTLGVSRLALVSSIAGITVHRGTIANIRQNLGRLEK